MSVSLVIYIVYDAGKTEQKHYKLQFRAGMKLTLYPISHITSIGTLRALQLGKTCSFSADRTAHNMASVYSENTLPVQGNRFNLAKP